MSWFTYKNVHSDAMGITVTEYPPIVRAEQRINLVKVPGRHGDLTLQSGPYVYDARVRECGCLIEPGADIAALASWLTGAGELVMGNEPQYAYRAQIINEISFEKVLRERAYRDFVIPFYCQPLKKLAVQEDDIELTATGSIITNPGHVDSRPRIKVEGSGDIIIMIGTESITHITGMVEPLIIDSELGLATDATMTKNASYLVSVDWPLIPVGTSAISFSGNVSKITITPRWRYL